MELKSLDEVRVSAETLPIRPLCYTERLECWARALEREGDRCLSSLFQIEYAPPALRAAIRADDSPITVAFNDPRLRAEGLAGDTVGDALTFFGISEKELHDILCFCCSGETMWAVAAARRVRALAARRV